MKLLGNFFGSFASVDVFIQDTLNADAGTAKADVVRSEDGEVVLEINGGDIEFKELNPLS